MPTPSFKSSLFSFAFIPNYDDAIKYLADTLADQENWDFSDTASKKYAILKKYLEFTFRKLKDESKICFTSNNEFAAFNTGLVTENLEEIFALFQKNKNKEFASKTPFFFKAFLKKSETQFLKHFSEKIPEIANYFENPELLLFNPKYQIITDIDHIIEDNILRFPSHLQDGDTQNVRRSLIGAIDEVKKRVKTNYKIAVPQYYNGNIQLLLPLCLTPGSPNPDLALVVNRINSTTYSSRTCLTLKMAYNNARLIVKPQSSWLKP